MTSDAESRKEQKSYVRMLFRKVRKSPQNRAEDCLNSSKLQITKEITYRREGGHLISQVDVTADPFPESGKLTPQPTARSRPFYPFYCYGRPFGRDSRFGNQEGEVNRGGLL